MARRPKTQASDDAGSAGESKEDVEGVDDPTSAWGNYPLDEIKVSDGKRQLRNFIDRIDSKRVVLDPEFQRDFVWNAEQQSRLIESVLMRIPLPVFYFAEDSDGRMIVVDGRQRITTFHRFLHDEFKLKLEGREDLNGKKFSQLTQRLRDRIEDCQLTFYILDHSLPERARLDIFERVNRGVPITRQQMRNCLYSGPATRFLREMATSPDFVEATGGSLRAGPMRDREFVNRFCAFRLLGPKAYTKDDMDAFLAEALKAMNALDNTKKLREDFLSSMKLNAASFEKQAFRRHAPTPRKRSPINAALFDVMSVLLCDVDNAARTEIRRAFFKLLESPAFVKAIKDFPNKVQSVHRRFELARDAFSGLCS